MFVCNAATLLCCTNLLKFELFQRNSGVFDIAISFLVTNIVCFRISFFAFLVQRERCSQRYYDRAMEMHWSSDEKNLNSFVECDIDSLSVRKFLIQNKFSVEFWLW